MKAIDMHSHWGTKKGYIWRTPEELKVAEKQYKFTSGAKTEKEMADDFRKAEVKAILDFGFTRTSSLDELKDMHNYAGEFMKANPDVVPGWWVAINPKMGYKGLRELERCLTKLGAIGFIANPTSLGIPPTDRAYFPFYEACIAEKALVELMVGYTAAGVGKPGGGGFILDHCHPRYVDEVAARFPELTIVAGRTAYPWEREMIAILLHKPNVWIELHGWSPKHDPAELKWDIGRRLQDKVMFGADYPMFQFERLYADWEAEGYKQEIMQKVYHENAERLFRSLGRKI